jgi:hypothetical protein
MRRHASTRQDTCQASAIGPGGRAVPAISHAAGHFCQAAGPALPPVRTVERHHGDTGPTWITLGSPENPVAPGPAPPGPPAGPLAGARSSRGREDWQAVRRAR